MNAPEPASRLPRVGTTIFTVMSQLALKHGAVNLGQGFPDFNCDPALQQHLDAAVRAGHNQYAPMPGVPALRLALAAKCEALYGRRYDAESEITVTAGATQAVMASVLALVQPGDEVIVLEPTYDSYVPSIVLAGATPRFVPLDAANGYAPDWERVRAAITPRTRLLMLNFPHNPTGRTLRTEDLTALEEIVAHHGLLLISDEVYEHIVFDGRPHLVTDALERARRAHRRGLELRQDVPHDRLEGRLCDGAARADDGDPQGAPVHGVCGQHAGAACICRLPADAGALPRAACVLPGEARPAGRRGCARRRFACCLARARTSCSPTTPRSAQRRNPNSRRR